MQKKELNYEESILRLSEIVNTIEDGETTLDSAITLYKEGLVLAQNCGDILGHYKKEVLMLQKAADESFVLIPFDEEDKTHG